MPLVPILGAAEILAGIFALLLLLSWKYWGQAVSNTLNFKIGVGGFSFNIFQPILDGLDLAYVATLLVLDSIVAPVANFITAPIAAIEDIMLALRDGIVAANHGVSYLINNVTPAAFNFIYENVLTQTIVIQAITDQLFNNFSAIISQTAAGLETHIAAGIGVAETYTDARITDLENTLHAVAVDTSQVASLATSAALAEIDAYLPQIDGLIQTGYTDAVAYADGIYRSVETDIAGALSSAEAFTTTAIAGVVGISVTDIDQAITGALAGIYTDVDGAITDVVGVLGADDPDILAAVKAIPFAVPTDLAGLAALAGTSTLALTRYLRDCGIPNCQNLGQLGKDLQALLGLVNDAAFLAFLVSLVEHPSAAAVTVSDEFGAAITSTVGAFRSLVGV